MIYTPKAYILFFRKDPPSKNVDYILYYPRDFFNHFIGNMHVLLQHHQ